MSPLGIIEIIPGFSGNESLRVVQLVMTRVLSGFPAEFINSYVSMGLLIHKSTLVLAILNGPVSSASLFSCVSCFYKWRSLCL